MNLPKYLDGLISGLLGVNVLYFYSKEVLGLSLQASPGSEPLSSFQKIMKN